MIVLGVAHPSRRLMNLMSRLFARIMLLISGVKLRRVGVEPYWDGRARFFVGNHQSAFDIPVLIACLRGDVRFFAKRSLFRIPILGQVLLRYGHVPIDREQNRKALGIITKALKRQGAFPFSFAIFPEGTRSMDGHLLPFRLGAMKICARAKLPVVPFAIDGSGAVHTRGHKRVHPGPVQIIFGPEISVERVQRMSARELGEEVYYWIARVLETGN